MRTIKYTLPVLLLMLQTFCFAASGDWYVYTSKGATVTFPKKPYTSTQKITSVVGDLEMETSILDLSLDTLESFKAAYQLTVVVYPDKVVNSSMTDKIANFFRGAVDQGIKNVDGKLLSEELIELDGFPGRAVKAVYNNGAFILIVRAYLVHNRLYMLTVSTEAGKEQNASTAKFLYSLKLKE